VRHKNNYEDLYISVAKNTSKNQALYHEFYIGSGNTGNIFFKNNGDV
jgi:hypothetical protein